MSRMQEAKNKNRPKERAETTSQVGKPKRKNQKGKTQSSHGDLKDATSTITPQDKLPEIVSQPSGHKDSIENAPNTPAHQLPPTHVDSGEEPAATTSSRGREKLEWYGSWEDD